MRPVLVRRPSIALLLSALVVPGLGQILTGRLKQGAIMMGGVAVWLPIALIKVGSDLVSVWPQLEARGRTWQLADLQAALAPKAESLTWFLMPLVFIWAWALADSVRYLLAAKKNGGS